MNVESLKAKQKETEYLFNKHGEDIKYHKSQVKTLSEERLRLQGDYRTLGEQIKEMDEVESPDPASTINIEENKENAAN